jgi:hypothetical protein
VSIVPRRPRRSEYEAIKAPQKHPAVNRATTVPDRESELVCRKLCLNESEATTSAITPLCESQPNEQRTARAVHLQIVSKEKRSNSCEAADQELVDSRLHHEFWEDTELEPGLSRVSIPPLYESRATSCLKGYRVYPVT